MKLSPAHQQCAVAFAQLQKNLSDCSIPPEFTNALCERCIPVAFEKGSTIFAEGSTDDILACVSSGYVKVYCPLGEGSRTLMRLAGPGELIGYPEYRDACGKRARMFEVVCATNCMLALISRDHVRRTLASQSPESLVEIIESLNMFWSSTVRRFATLLTLPYWNRLETVLADIALRAGVKDSRGTMLLPELVHEDLAEMIGCSRPMVSRIISEMTDRGMLDRNGHHYILLGNWDLEQLRAQALGPCEFKQVAINGLIGRSNGDQQSLRETGANPRLGARAF